MKSDEKNQIYTQEKGPQKEKTQDLTDKQEGKEEKLFYDSESRKTVGVCESLVAYGTEKKRQGEYTVEDYRNWPAEERVELIDGEIIQMESPSFNHQAALQEFNIQFSLYILKKKGKCRVLTSPLDVQLDEDDQTMLQPDLLILCDERKIRSWGIFGAPDFVLEILSPSTRTYDMIRKKNKYIAAGVKEYWILDLEKEKIITYAEKNGYVSSIHPLQGRVGVVLYDNDLEIELDFIRGRLHRE